MRDATRGASPFDKNTGEELLNTMMSRIYIYIFKVFGVIVRSSATSYGGAWSYTAMLNGSNFIVNEVRHDPENTIAAHHFDTYICIYRLYVCGGVVNRI